MNRANAMQITSEVVDIEERSWLPRHSRGDTQAFEQLLSAYRGFILTFLWRYGIDRHNRDDLFQEIFLRIHLAASSYRPSQALRPWITTIVLNTIRNHRRDQFLRLSLPGDSEIWSVFVNGEAQKPAFAAGQDKDSRDVLIKMINSASAFSVELMYATRNKGMDTFGRIEGFLPRPDMIVTQTNWDVYVPAAPRYGTPKTNMEVLAGNSPQPVQLATAGLLREVMANVITGEPLHIELPTQGVLYRFAKPYANQAKEDAYFTLRYVHQKASFAGFWISLLAAAAIWAGIILIGMKYASVPHYLPVALVAGGTVLLALCLLLLGASVAPASVLSLVIAAAAAAWMAGKDGRSGESDGRHAG